MPFLTEYVTCCCRYAYNSDVGTYTPTYYGGSTPVSGTAGAMAGYDISADYAVDSTTAYDPRPGLDALADTPTLIANVVTTGNNITYFIIENKNEYSLTTAINVFF